MEKKSEILENFKTAISSTVKSLSNLENVEVSFGNQNTHSKNTLIKLPEVEEIKNKINYSKIRALADSKSLKIRFSDSKIFKLHAPEGNTAKKLYKIAEKIRYEKLGSEQFKGVKNNIERYYQERVNSLDLKSSEDKITESFENYLRIKFFNSKNNKELEKKIKNFRKDFDEKLENKIKKLEDLKHDQARYNSLISQLISKLSLDESLEENNKDLEDKNQNQKNDEKQNNDDITKKQEQEQQEMSIESGVPDLEGETSDSDQFRSTTTSTQKFYL